MDALELKNTVHSAKIQIQLNKLNDTMSEYITVQDQQLMQEDKRLSSFSKSLLILVNPWNELPSYYMPHLTQVEDGYSVDRRCAKDLTEMLEACRLSGGNPVICSAYRTQAYQQELFDNSIKKLLAAGISPADAPQLAARSVAVPGTSEHQTGLALDIIDYYNVNLDESQAKTSTQIWLMANCSDYGFILRYPDGTSDTTGIIFEPWHYRYVGKTAAKEISEAGITLEEYVSLR